MLPKPSPPRQTRVQWKYSVEDYQALNSIESRTTTPEPLVYAYYAKPDRSNTHRHNSSINSIASSSGSSSSSAPPSTPQLPTVPLPGSDSPPLYHSTNDSAMHVPTSAPSSEFVLHECLRANNHSCFVLDLSFPSAHFLGNPQLRKALDAGILDAPAVQPSVPVLNIAIAVGTLLVFEMKIECRPELDFVCVGDVIGGIQRYLRQPLTRSELNGMSVADELRWYFDRRVDTVNGAGPHRHPERLQSVAEEERKRGLRRVDLLRGYTMFKGLEWDNSASGTGFGVLRCEANVGVPGRYERAS